MYETVTLNAKFGYDNNLKQCYKMSKSEIKSNKKSLVPPGVRSKWSMSHEMPAALEPVDSADWH
jgi:hypothetical protein